MCTILGQSVPAGLHIRMNLETGKKEAKLLENEDNKSKEVSIHVTDSIEGNPDTLEEKDTSKLILL